VTEPDNSDGVWRVRMGVALVMHTPMSDERREAFLREEERERIAVEFEEQQRQEAAAERRWMLAQQGVQPLTHSEFLARASFAQDREDAAERRREREAAELLGKPEPRLDRWELKREQQPREAEALTTPATQAEVSKLSQAVTQLKSNLHAQGRRSAEQGMERRRESPEEYARAYGGVRYRSGGGVVRGPY
jgi:hypothetical protein